MHLKRTWTMAPPAMPPRSPTASNRRRCSLKSRRLKRSACAMGSAVWPSGGEFFSTEPSRSTNCTKLPFLYFTGKKMLSRQSTFSSPSMLRVRPLASGASSSIRPSTRRGSEARQRTSSNGLKLLFSAADGRSLLAPTTSHQTTTLLPSRLELVRRGPEPGRRVQHTALTSRPASSIASFEPTRLCKTVTLSTVKATDATKSINAFCRTADTWYS
mmetsp:Transcript_20762/g.48295  ORF Transcript_20762/g.48295 Transcript_20762/m.48295 type:complete len:215 (-) Transcript_20762:113-757(-)